MTTWRSYDESMNSDHPQIEQRNGFSVEWRGARMALACHESGHFAAAFALGGHVADVVLRAHYLRGAFGDLWTKFDGYHGKWRADGHTFEATARPEIPDVPPGPHDFLFPFGMKLRAAIIACGGAAAEFRYKALNDLPQSTKHTSAGDRRDLEDLAKIERNANGCDPEFFTRLAWERTQELIANPTVWRAVEALASELVTGIMHAQPDDPRPGDVAEFVMTAAQAEALMTKAGLQHGMFSLLHRRVPEGYGAVHDVGAMGIALAHKNSMGGS